MLRQYLRKQLKLFRGLYRSRLGRNRQDYAANAFWDEKFYVKGLSDRQTISAEKNILAAAYHYSSVEMLILRFLHNNDYDLDGYRICDLGAGTGHWLDFYMSLGAGQCFGIDISKKAVEFLAQKYESRSNVSVRCGKISHVLDEIEGEFDLVNAIGIMFHIVDDREWVETIERVGQVLLPGGLFIVGGHFGWLDDLDVGFSEGTGVVKRLRSSARWRRVLREAGFNRIWISRNRAYLHIRDTMPENNVLIARRA